LFQGGLSPVPGLLSPPLAPPLPHPQLTDVPCTCFRPHPQYREGHSIFRDRFDFPKLILISWKLIPGIAWSKYLISAYLVEILKYIYHKCPISAYLVQILKYIYNKYLISAYLVEILKYIYNKYLISDVCVICKFSHIYVIVYLYFSIYKFVRTFKICRI
jgi:hypothetical protein